ncbi:hypothetical protein PSCFBP3800_04295 [Pseudomonas syringae group genomosp. 3]|uniref:Uncharacterized protein n=1 Tax=Pseudomonas syringae group genomosp. 3 TaxID=251701 RepID=A0A2K4WHY7_9PSED|nr:hypothetical protein CFBP6411_04159 [Pseudomonas syringae group genomosp. 3]SPF19751.1 hypothetical protein PSCFBP3800_04295 [Pseudomonas syringae group genomosp. 3]
MLPVPVSSRTSPLLRKPRSRTSEASSGPLPRNTHHAGLLPGGRMSGPGDASLVREGVRSGPETGHLGVPDIPYASFLQPVPGSSRTSPLLRNPRLRTSQASPALLPRNTHHAGLLPEGVGADRATLRLSAKGCEAALKSVTLVCLIYRMRLFCSRFPSVRGQVRSYENRGRGQAKRRSVCLHLLLRLQAIQVGEVLAHVGDAAQQPGALLRCALGGDVHQQ